MTTHVSNRSADCHRKASSQGSSLHETNSVAPEKQLACACTPQIIFLHWWLEETHMLPDESLHPLKHTANLKIGELTLEIALQKVFCQF